MNTVKSAVRTGLIIVVFGLMLAGCGKKSGNTNLQDGMKHVEEYDFQGALECFSLALLKNEDKQLVYRGQGIAYMGLGNYAEAEAAFLQSIAYAANTFRASGLDYDTNYYLAAAYMKQGKYAEAEKIYSAIIGLRKKETNAYYLRACAILRQNRYDEAMKDFEKAFSLSPGNLELVTDAYVEMQAAGYGSEGKEYVQKFLTENEGKLKQDQKGRIYFYLEDYENARIQLDEFINGSNPELSMILGQTYEKLDNMDYAALVYETYLKGNEPDAAIYNSLGICLMQQEKYEEAKTNFEAGIAMGNSDYLQELKFNLIVANEYLGDFAQAKTLIQEYMQMYPDDSAAKKESQFLLTR